MQKKAVRDLKRCAIALLVALTALALGGCKQNPAQEQLYGKLFAAFEDAGYSCTLEDVPEGAQVGIYDATVWKILRVGDEQVLVYFDESNRADYLVTMIDESAYGYVTHFGQRFVLSYSGRDQTLLALLEAM